MYPAKDESVVEAFLKRRAEADPNVCCDYGLHVNLDFIDDRVKKEMTELVEKHGT